MTSQALEALAAKKRKLESEVDQLDKEIYEAETEYIAEAECTAFGTVTKGFEGFLTSKNAQLKNKGRIAKVDERLFSLSSATSIATRDYQVQKEFGDDSMYDRRGRMYGATASGVGKR